MPVAGSSRPQLYMPSNAGRQRESPRDFFFFFKLGALDSLVSFAIPESPGLVSGSLSLSLSFFLAS